MIPAHTNPVYYPGRPAPHQPVLKKQVRFVSEYELSSDSDDYSDTDSLCSSDTETSVTSSGSWPEQQHDSTSKIVPKSPILDFRNPAFGKFFDTIDVDSPEAQRIASLDLVRFEANLQLILRTSNVTFPLATAGVRPHTHRGHRPLPSRNEVIAIARAGLELREAIRAIEPLLARMHRSGLDIKEMAKCLRSTKKVLDSLENDEADQLERGVRPVETQRPSQPSKKPTPVEVRPTRNASPPRSHHVAKAPAPSTTTSAPPPSSPPTSSSTREPSPPRAVRRKPVPEAFPREQAQPTAATPTPTPTKSLAIAVVHTKTPPPASTPPKKRNNLPAAPAAAPAPAAPQHRAPLSPPVYPSITIEGPTPTNPPIALPVAYQSVPAYPSRTNVPESAPSPRVVTYRRVSWPESDGRGGFVVPVSQGHITASHVARC